MWADPGRCFAAGYRFGECGLCVTSEMAARRPVNNRLHQPYLKDLTLTNVMLGVGSFGRVFEVKHFILS